MKVQKSHITTGDDVPKTDKPHLIYALHISGSSGSYILSTGYSNFCNLK